MIQVSYYSVSAPSGEIRYESSGEGLCLVSGVESRSFLDILELKGSYEYAGMFRVFESDLLDINNANRDRYPVSVIRAQDSSFLLQRSQVPLGGSLDTTKIDKLVDAYLNDHDIKANQSPNFLRLFQAVYCELSANAKYVVLELLGEDKDFSFAVLDLASKIFADKSIFLYAPLLTPNETRTIVLSYQFDSILNPIEDQASLEKERERTAIQMTFIRDLRGKDTGSLPEKKRNTIGMKAYEIKDSDEEEEESRGLFSFGKNATMIHMGFAIAFAVIAFGLGLSDLLLGIANALVFVFAILAGAILGMNLLSLSILNKECKKAENSLNLLFISVLVSGGISFAGLIFYFAIGISKAFENWYIYFVFVAIQLIYITILSLLSLRWKRTK